MITQKRKLKLKKIAKHKAKMIEGKPLKEKRAILNKFNSTRPRKAMYDPKLQKFISKSTGEQEQSGIRKIFNIKTS